MEREAEQKEKAQMSKCQVFITALNETLPVQGIAVDHSFSQGDIFSLFCYHTEKILLQNYNN